MHVSMTATTSGHLQCLSCVICCNICQVAWSRALLPTRSCCWTTEMLVNMHNRFCCSKYGPELSYCSGCNANANTLTCRRLWLMSWRRPTEVMSGTLPSAMSKSTSQESLLPGWSSQPCTPRSAEPAGSTLCLSLRQCVASRTHCGVPHRRMHPPCIMRGIVEPRCRSLIWLWCFTVTAVVGV